MDNYTNAVLNGYGMSIQSLLSKHVAKGSAAAARKMAYLRSLRKGGRRKITGMKSMRKKKGGLLGTLMLGTLGAVGIHKLNQLLKQKQGSGIMSKLPPQLGVSNILQNMNKLPPQLGVRNILQNMKNKKNFALQVSA